jgi:inorganic pyrophosphatase
MTLFLYKLTMQYNLIPLHNKDGGINVIIETPKGFRNKYAYDEEFGLIALTKTLPAGSSFPFDFGFIPQTKGGDGDPLDVLVIMEEPAFAGCLVNCRILGASSRTD